MTHIYSAILSLFLLHLTTVCFADENTPGKELFGKWVLVEMIYRGVAQDLPKDYEQVNFDKMSMWFTIEGKDDARRYECTFRPGELDISILPNNVVTKAKYDLNDDKLRIIWAQGDGERPTDFDALKDKRLTLRVLKRVGK